MNKALLFLIIVLTTIFLTGCWNYTEIDKMALVSGMAIDKSDSGEGYEINVEMIDVEPSDKNPTFKSVRIESKGESIFDSIRNIINISAKTLYWSHATTVIVSKDLAKDGVLPVLDWIARDPQARLSIYLLISDTNNAKEILNLQSLSTEIRSFEIENMIISNSDLSKIPQIQVYELINDISTKGIYPVIPTVGPIINEGKKTMELSGGAILKQDSLAGFINLEDIKYYLFVRNKIKGGLLNINLKNDDSKSKMTLEVFKNKTKITPKISDGKLSMSIKVKTQVSIGESDNRLNIIDKSENLKIKDSAEKYLEDNILDVIEKMQKDFGLDIFGFGNIVKEKMPNLWKSVEDEWDTIFQQLNIEVDADVHIRGSGHLSRVINKH
jgi:spore germination protein KC